MGSHILDILRQGIWASLTGGWFYDPHQSIFCNTFHLYLWMFLLSFPLILHLTLGPSIAVWTLYCGIIGALFLVVKLLNFKLHYMYDTGDVEEEETRSETKGSKAGSVDLAKSIEIRDVNSNPECIEMVPLGRTREATPGGTDDKKTRLEVISELKTDEGSDGHDDHTHRENGRKGKDLPGIAPLAEVEGDDLVPESGTCHQPGSTESSLEGVQRQDIPHSITTQAEVEINPHIPKSGQGNRTEKPARLREESDSDLSPEYVPKLRLRRERRAVRRSKSALEANTGSSQVLGDQKQGARMSLPPFSRVPVSVVSKHLTDVHRPPSEGQIDIVRPVSDIIEGSPVVCKPERDKDSSRCRTRTPSTKSLDMLKVKLPKRSQSVTNDALPHEQLKTGSPSLRRPASLSLSSEDGQSRCKHSPQSSVSDYSVISVGEIYVPSVSERPSAPVPHQRPGSRPGSGGTSSSGQTLTERGYSPVMAGCATKNKDLGIFKIARFLHGPEMAQHRPDHSQQSSTVGLDWLFSTDSDSVTSGESHSHTSISESTSTITNEDESSYDVSSDQHNIRYQPLAGLECTTTPSSPSTDDLEVMRSQGAIPKHYQRKPLPDAVTGTGDHSTSPGSTDLSDPEEIKRKLFEILCKPSDHPEEIKRLQEFVKLKKKPEQQQ